MLNYKDDILGKDNFLEIKDVNSIKIFENCSNESFFFTIVIPTFRRHRLLCETIDSALNQKTNINFDVLVLDNDDAGDETEKMMFEVYGKTEKIRYFKNQKNLGMVGNWNRGIELAKGKYIVMLHDDDLLCENYIEEVYNAILNNKNVDFIGVRNGLFGTKQINTVSNKVSIKSRLRNFLFHEQIIKLKGRDAFFNNSTPINGCCFKGETAIALGGFYTGSLIADAIFSTNFIINKSAYAINKKLVKVRIEENESLKYETTKMFIVDIYYFRKYLLNQNYFKFRTFYKYFMESDIYKMRDNYKNSFGNYITDEDLKKEVELVALYKNKFFKIINLVILRLNLMTKYLRGKRID